MIRHVIYVSWNDLRVVGAVEDNVEEITTMRELLSEKLESAAGIGYMPTLEEIAKLPKWNSEKLYSSSDNFKIYNHG